MSSCQKIRPGATRYAGQQGFDDVEGIKRERVGATGPCMMVLPELDERLAWRLSRPPSAVDRIVTLRW